MRVCDNCREPDVSGVRQVYVGTANEPSLDQPADGGGFDLIINQEYCSGCLTHLTVQDWASLAAARVEPVKAVKASRQRRTKPPAPPGPTSGWRPPPGSGAADEELAEGVLDAIDAGAFDEADGEER